MSRERTLSDYLDELGQACHEAADDPRLRPLLFRLLEFAAEDDPRIAGAERPAA